MSAPRYGDQNVMEFRTTQLKSLRTLFDALKENIDDTSLSFTSEGMTISTIARGSALMINVKLEADKFDHYYCKEDVRLDVSVPNISKVLKTITNDNDVIIWSYDINQDYFTVTITSTSKGEQCQYNITLQESDDNNDQYIIDDDELNESDCVLTMPCVDFQRICRDFKSLNVNTINIEYMQHQTGPLLCFSSKSDVATTKVVRNGIIGDDMESEKNIIFTKMPDQETCYSDQFKFEFLYNFSKCANIGSKGGKIVKIYLRQGSPIILVFNVGTLGDISFLLAPIEEETTD